MSFFENSGNKAYNNTKKAFSVVPYYFLELRALGDEEYYAGSVERAAALLVAESFDPRQWGYAESKNLENISKLLSNFGGVVGYLKVVLAKNYIDAEDVVKDINEGHYVLVSESYCNKGHIMNTTSFSTVNEYSKNFWLECKREKIRIEIEDKVQDLLYLTQLKEKEINAMKDKLNALTT